MELTSNPRSSPLLPDLQRPLTPPSMESGNFASNLCNFFHASSRNSTLYNSPFRIERQNSPHTVHNVTPRNIRNIFGPFPIRSSPNTTTNNSRDQVTEDRPSGLHSSGTSRASRARASRSGALRVRTARSGVHRATSNRGAGTSAPRRQASTRRPRGPRGRPRGSRSRGQSRLAPAFISEPFISSPNLSCPSNQNGANEFRVISPVHSPALNSEPYMVEYEVQSSDGSELGVYDYDDIAANEYHSNDSNVCVVCCDRPVTHKLLPCLHASFCETCCLRIFNYSSNICPLCREPIESWVEL